MREVKIGLSCAREGERQGERQGNEADNIPYFICLVSFERGPAFCLPLHQRVSPNQSSAARNSVQEIWRRKFVRRRPRKLTKPDWLTAAITNARETSPALHVQRSLIRYLCDTSFPRREINGGSAIVRVCNLPTSRLEIKFGDGTNDGARTIGYRRIAQSVHTVLSVNNNII